MSRPTSSPPPRNAPNATPVLRVLVKSRPRKTLTLSPRRSDSTAICLVAWSSATTTPAVAAALAKPAVAGLISAVDEVDHDAAHDEQHEDRDHRAEVERPRPDPQGRQDAAEEVEVGVGDVLDELEHRVERRVVGDAGDPGEDDPDEDQDEVDEQQRV